MLKLVYVAGPYRAKSGAHDASAYNEIEQNIRNAEAAAIKLWEAGFGAFCPHLNSDHFEVKAPNVRPEAYLEADLRWLAACDILYLLPGWQGSSGSCRERDRAVYDLGMPVYHDLDHLIAMEGSDA